MVAATAMVPPSRPPPQLFRFPLRLFVFLRSFSVCATILALKEGCIWPYWDENS